MKNRVKIATILSLCFFFAVLIIRYQATGGVNYFGGGVGAEIFLGVIALFLLAFQLIRPAAPTVGRWRVTKKNYIHVIVGGVIGIIIYVFMHDHYLMH